MNYSYCKVIGGQTIIIQVSFYLFCLLFTFMCVRLVSGQKISSSVGFVRSVPFFRGGGL